MRSLSQRTVLLTGFDPFGGETINPSWEAVSSLHGEIVDGHRIESLQLPTSFTHSTQVLRRAIRRFRLALVICVGQAGGRDAISLERVAINLIDARIADNDGVQPVDKPVVRGAPSAYFTSLPIKAILAELGTAGICAEISQTAGTFVCNHAFYALMHTLDAIPTPRPRGGFVHIPYLPEQASSHQTTSNHTVPSMPIDTVAAALRIVVTTSLRARKDRRIAAGATH
jgi:pyroglutamyl-peptidase